MFVVPPPEGIGWDREASAGSGRSSSCKTGVLASCFQQLDEAQVLSLGLSMAESMLLMAFDLVRADSESLERWEKLQILRRSLRVVSRRKKNPSQRSATPWRRRWSAWPNSEHGRMWRSRSNAIGCYWHMAFQRGNGPCGHLIFTYWYCIDSRLILYRLIVYLLVSWTCIRQHFVKKKICSNIVRLSIKICCVDASNSFNFHLLTIKASNFKSSSRHFKAR